MQRLTEKTKYGYKEIDDCCITACSDKLGQLEDIEQELGIDITKVKDLVIETHRQIEYYDNQAKRNNVAKKLNPEMIHLYASYVIRLKDLLKIIKKEELEK